MEDKVVDSKVSHFMQRERQFENALRKERGLVMKRMRPDGACLFRAVGMW